MVLGDLGVKITNALKKLNQASTIDEALLKEILEDICKALLQADVNVKQVLKLRENVRLQVNLLEKEKGTLINLKNIIRKAVINELSSMLDSKKEPYMPLKGETSVIMFVGLQGSGKTTTCTKLAYYYKHKHFQVALVCADTFRAGAFAQLRQNAAKIKVDFYGNEEEKDPVKVALDGVNKFKELNYEIIIVDTSGKHKQEESLFKEMIEVQSAIHPNEVIFVMDSSIGQACFDQATGFKNAVKLGSVIMTKLDSHAKGGGALSAVAATESPIIFTGNGEHFEDLEQFNAKSFISRLLGFGDIKNLYEKVKENISEDKQKQLMKDIAKGNFTYKHMKDQFINVMNMGPLDQVMSMIPGLSSSLLAKGKEKEGAMKIKKFIYMIDSMTADEMNCIKKIDDSRATRIARGSGCYVGEVKDLVQEFKKIKTTIEKLGKAGIGNPGNMSEIMRNPSAMMSKLGKVVDPRIMQQMGGPQNMMNMVKEFSKMEGMDEIRKVSKKK